MSEACGIFTRCFSAERWPEDDLRCSTLNSTSQHSWLAPVLAEGSLNSNPNRLSFHRAIQLTRFFYLQNGRAKITVVSTAGTGGHRHSTRTARICGRRSAIGSARIASIHGHRYHRLLGAQNKPGRDDPCNAQPEHQFSDLFVKFLLARSMRSQADLIDQLFNSSEKRLARILLLMAEYGEPGEPETQIPPISQETLAEMIGTTRSRVSFFMNRFRRLGVLSKYNGRIQVHKVFVEKWFFMIECLALTRVKPRSASSMARDAGQVSPRPELAVIRDQY